jgi:glycosyltransferase involved in cell wall biosynthesis
MLSIITPVLNGEKFIEKNIISIQELSIPFEHIIVDGGSTDGTIDILKKFKHINVVNQKRLTGMYGAIDLGFKHSNGKYLCWINCDDTIIKNGFEKMYEAISSDKFDLVYSNSYWYFFSENKKKLKPGINFAKYFLKNGFLPFTQPSSIWKKNVYKNCGGLNYEIFKIIGDKDLFMRMAYSSKLKFKYVNVVSSIFLKHGNSLGDNNVERYHQELKLCPKQNIVFTSILYKIIETVNKCYFRINYKL